MEKRFRDMLYTPSALSEKEMQSIRKKYDFYRITYKNGKVAGRPIYFVRHSRHTNVWYPIGTKICSPDWG